MTLSPNSKPAMYPGRCQWCRGIIRPSHTPGQGDWVAFIPAVDNYSKKRLVHERCAIEYLQQKDTA